MTGHVAHDERDVHEPGRHLEGVRLEHAGRGRQGDADDFGGEHGAGRFYPRVTGRQTAPVKTARSLWFVAPRDLEIRETLLPSPAGGQVTVRTVCSGISAGTEMLAYRGLLDAEMPVDEAIGTLGGTFRYPFQYGYSCVGHVEASRSDVRVGELVFAFHPHQDHFVVDAGDVIVLHGTEPRHATLLPFVETALQVTLDAGQVFEETVVVIGAGVLGLLTIALLRRAGAEVIALEPQPWRRDLANGLGATAVAPDEAIGAITGAGRPDGVALVIEASGNPAALPDALRLLAHEGTALVASWYGTRDAVLPLGDRFHRRRLTIRSTQVSTIPARLADRWDRRRRQRAVVELLGSLPLDVLATHTYPFEDAAAAYAAIDEAQPGLIHAALGYK